MGVVAEGPEEATCVGISLAQVPFQLGPGVGQPLPAGQLWSQRLVPLGFFSPLLLLRVAGLIFK